MATPMPTTATSPRMAMSTVLPMKPGPNRESLWVDPAGALSLLDVIGSVLSRGVNDDRLGGVIGGRVGAPVLRGRTRASAVVQLVNQVRLIVKECQHLGQHLPGRFVPLLMKRLSRLRYQHADGRQFWKELRGFLPVPFRLRKKVRQVSQQVPSRLATALGHR